MKEILFDSGYKKNKIVLSLGFFDCVHRGHAFLIDSATDAARRIGAESFVFTFSNNPYAYFEKAGKEIFLYGERLKLFEARGADGAIHACLDEGFAALSAEEFIKKLFTIYDITEVFCGSDYAFGQFGSGNVELLKRTAEEFGVKVNIVDFVLENQKKISSSTIKYYLKQGNIEQSNALLGHIYLISGKVVHNAGRGAGLGFPTANIEVCTDKLYPAKAVYATEAEVDGKIYPAITNVGGKPTFDDDTFTVESYIENYNGNLYGKDITVYFYGKIRDIIKFGSAEEFKAQLKKDLIFARGLRRKL